MRLKNASILRQLMAHYLTEGSPIRESQAISGRVKSKSGIGFPENRLRELQSILGLCEGGLLKDVVVVSFDLEPKGDSPQNKIYNEIAQIGVSMLDTRSFSPSTPAGRLVTRHFVVGGQKRLRHKSREFHFGTSEHVDPDNVNDLILKLLQIPDELARVRMKLAKGEVSVADTLKSSSSKTTICRDIVLVGHGLRSHLLVLRRRGIRFEEINTIVAKLDTSYIAREVLGMNFQLHGLLKTLNCPLEHIHNAGNDANFTPRALLLLAYYGLRPYFCSSSILRDCIVLPACSRGCIPMLEGFKALTLEPLPDTTQRNEMLRKSELQCEDWALHALDMGSISFEYP
ncbi:uncharacterized protein PAC_19132 [Phialocephala subalpina]|uniref:Gfd2/YDR514C-like C-terminal domain-containing protein n=1 Tax=Phialocephala subalpina TaxID=576137 RepID=A0A1L7XVZ8_9HELO|nr:uncharacterized protein PAC_19132 [Phialocephala subalpina]